MHVSDCIVVAYSSLLFLFPATPPLPYTPGSFYSPLNGNTINDEQEERQNLLGDSLSDATGIIMLASEQSDAFSVASDEPGDSRRRQLAVLGVGQLFHNDEPDRC